MFFKRPICHPVLPSVYDDSLSYYEVLCKLASAVDNLVEEIQKIKDKPETETYSMDMRKHATEGDTTEYSANFSVGDKTKVKCVILSFSEDEGIVNTAILLPNYSIAVNGIEVTFFAQYSDGVVNVSGISSSASYECTLDAIVIY